MKINKKSILVFVIVLIFSIGAMYNIMPKSRYYKSIDDAVVQDRFFRNTEYIGQLESNDVCKVLYNKKGDSVHSQYLIKDKTNWKLMDAQGLFTLKKSGLNSTVNYYKIGGKHIISVDDLVAFGQTKEVHDSISSEFSYFEYAFPEQYGQTMTLVVWLVAFDELPENYSVTVDGETVALN